MSNADPEPVHIHVWKAPEVLPEVQACPCGELRVTPRPQWRQRDAR